MDSRVFIQFPHQPVDFPWKENGSQVKLNLLTLASHPKNVGRSTGGLSKIMGWLRTLIFKGHEGQHNSQFVLTREGKDKKDRKIQGTMSRYLPMTNYIFNE